MNIDIRRKFCTIIYNKKFQKLLNINIVDYRRLSGKYKIEENNSVIIYNSCNNEILYKGNYLNGKKNGYGREYNEENHLIFIGEYLNNKMWKGKRYIYDDDNDHIIFQFNYLNGEINGEGEEYDKFNGKIIFSGKYINGQRKEGKEYNYKGNLIYEGEYLKGKRNGNGKLYNDNKLKYEGEFKNGKKHGNGIEYEQNKSSKYIGEFSYGKKNGKGKEYFCNYHDDRNKSDLMFEGEYFNNYRIRGKEYYKNGKLKFEGEYLFQEKLDGKLYDYDGNIIYELINGNGIIEDNDYYNKINISFSFFSL